MTTQPDGQGLDSVPALGKEHRDRIWRDREGDLWRWTGEFWCWSRGNEVSEEPALPVPADGPFVNVPTDLISRVKYAIEYGSSDRLHVELLAEVEVLRRYTHAMADQLDLWLRGHPLTVERKAVVDQLISAVSGE